MEIDLGDSGLLCFQNAEQERDSLIGFRGTPWHTHDDLTFVDGRGHYVELDYIDLLTGLAEGKVLICERLREGKLMDRWLIHRDYNDVFKYMETGEQIIARRAQLVDATESEIGVLVQLACLRFFQTPVPRQ